MSEEELKALFSDMLSKDIKPMLCDTRVPLYDSPVPCGEPTYCPEDIVETVMLPRELLSVHPVFMLPVKGDSMKDAGIVAGDIVKVEADVTPCDGDIVLACIDGDYTLKTYFEDDEGQHWLVPQNDKYEPILLEERQNVRIFGRVKEVVKQTPRIASRLCMKIINRARQLRMKKQEISQERVSSIIRQMAPKVKIGRQWYAVYKPMEEKSVFPKEDYAGFCERVAKEVPEHKHLPTVVELQRMAVQSFKKPVRLWNPTDAPVQGKRFTAYEQIGLQTLGMLETEE